MIPLELARLAALLKVKDCYVCMCMGFESCGHCRSTSFWEESFKVYEKGVAIFKYPHVRDIWLAYLQQFAKRYGRHQARACPPTSSSRPSAMYDALPLLCMMHNRALQFVAVLRICTS